MYRERLYQLHAGNNLEKEKVPKTSDKNRFDFIESVRKSKDQESIQLSTIPDPRYQWESDKLTVDTIRINGTTHVPPKSGLSGILLSAKTIYS